MAQIQTLGKVLHGRPLKAICRRCGHSSQWPAPVALKLFGEHATPYEVGRRVKCSKCGSKTCNVGL